MIAELGHFALALALAVAVVQAVLPLWAAVRPSHGAEDGAHDGTGHAVAARTPWLLQLARPAARVQFALLAVAYAALTACFLGHDFSVALAAQHSNSALPWYYRITAVWGNHEGSVLLWALVLAGWSAAVSWRCRALDERTVAQVLAVMGCISVGFLLFTLAVSNPFLRMLPAPDDGRDLNPLLQDPGMIIHPPLLYMGYVGLAVPFAFAVSALISGRLDAAWARWSRPWTTAAWCFLTCGIALGSFWAYYELGWGGWWFWDPVENASFMPWLVATALMHSLAVTEKRGTLKGWTVLLAIMAFALSLLGTFIVRSGVLTSVHAFATDPARGVFILLFLAAVAGGSLALYAWRAPTLAAGEAASFTAVSRESLLLANNALLLVAAAAVLLGTVYPLAIEALNLGKLSVGPPYFEAVFVPLIAPAIFLMGVGPLARWRHASAWGLALQLRWAAGVSVASALAAMLLLWRLAPMAGLGALMAAWGAFTAVQQLVQRLREHPARGGWRAWRAQSGGFWGMLVAHFGIAVFIAGVTAVGSLQSERDLRMAPGEHAELAGYRFALEGIERTQGPNYLALTATMRVTRDGHTVALLHPQRRHYTTTRMPMTEVALDRGVWRDLYVALGEPIVNGNAASPDAPTFSVRIHHKPLVNWIWGGCVLMALGGLMAAMDARYRRRSARAAAASARAAPGASAGHPDSSGLPASPVAAVSPAAPALRTTASRVPGVRS
ncbi:MAG: heme lyase CcmF/NrfE family subunit [Burkholderiaceae bacterium]